MDKLREPENMMRFIEKYWELRNQWEIKNKHYYNNNVRRATIKQLAIYMQTWIPDSTMINNKIDNIRNAYKKRGPCFSEVRSSSRRSIGAKAVVLQTPPFYGRSDQGKRITFQSCFHPSLHCSLQRSFHGSTHPCRGCRGAGWARRARSEHLQSGIVVYNIFLGIKLLLV